MAIVKLELWNSSFLYSMIFVLVLLKFFLSSDFFIQGSKLKEKIVETHAQSNKKEEGSYTSHMFYADIKRNSLVSTIVTPSFLASLCFCHLCRGKR